MPVPGLMLVLRAFGDGIRKWPFLMSKYLANPRSLVAASPLIRPAATVLYKRLATLISGHPYRKTLFWIRCKLSFSLLRSTVMCIPDQVITGPIYNIQLLTWGE